MLTSCGFDEAAGPARWVMVATWPAVSLILIVAFFVQIGRPLNHDVAWFFYVARGTVFHGGVLYSDYIEPSFPPGFD